MIVSAPTAIREIRILLVAADAQAAPDVVHALEGVGECVQVHQARGLGDVRDWLQAASFDAVVTDHDFAAWTSLDVIAVCKAEGRGVPVIVRGGSLPEVRVAAILKAGAVAYVDADRPGHLATTLPEAVRDVLDRPDPDVPSSLQEVVNAVMRVNHDVKNPLAIIAGNAQLLLELGRMLNLDDDLMQPIRDIEEASQRLALSLAELTHLRDRLRIKE